MQTSSSSATDKCRAPGVPSPATLDNAQITVGATTERAQRLLVRSTVMGSDGLCDAGEFEHHDAFVEPTFVNARGQPACQEAATCRLEGRPGQPGISSESLRITCRTVRRDPIRPSHGRVPPLLRTCFHPTKP